MIFFFDFLWFFFVGIILLKLGFLNDVDVLDDDRDDLDGVELGLVL